MINKKTVTIKKQTHFDKSWALFTPITLPKVTNESYKNISINDILPYISKAKEIHLILGRNGIPSAIMSELKWVNKYIQFKVIAKNEKVLSYFSEFEFCEVNFDKTVDFNYIGIKGKEDLFLMLDGDNIKVDASIDQLFFENEKILNTLDFKGVQEVYILDLGDNQFLDFINTARYNKIKITYICDEKNFSKETFDIYYKLVDKLVVSDIYTSAIFVIKQSGASSYIYKAGNYIPIEFPSLHSLIQKAYLNVNKNLEDLVSGGDIFFLCDGKLDNLKIIPNIDVNKKVNLDNYKDFIEENFEKSIVENYNDYSHKSLQVTYNFELIPPIIDNTYNVSDIYKGMLGACDKWLDEKKNSKMDLFEQEIASIDDENIFIELFKSIENFNKFLTDIRTIRNVDFQSDFTFNGYYSKLFSYDKIIKEFRDGFTQNCKELYFKLSQQNSGIKFNKFDDEICEYQNIIKDKESLIERGIDVLSNKRRVEILNKKINDLKALKSNFEIKGALISDKNCDEFWEKCNKYIQCKTTTKSPLSISNVLKVKELEKTVLLEQVFEKRLKDFYDFIIFTEETLEKLKSQDFPEDYLVFEKNKSLYIVISEESEYKDTQAIQKKYNLNCITGR